MQELSDIGAAANPFHRFAQWFSEAQAAGLNLPEAMALATVGPEGRPSARMVLLKGFDDQGFVFYTDYQSRKARELATNPWAAGIVFWVELQRQFRIEGSVEKVTPQESDAYFATWPRGSQLAAWASHQSQVIQHHETLERRMDELVTRYGDQAVPRPPYWGGYRLRPSAIEFWQGRPDRLHDRLRYTRQDDGSWLAERLAP